jgi:hypothetical protein
MRAYMCARAHPCWRSLLCGSLALAHSMCRSFRVAPIVWSDVRWCRSFDNKMHAPSSSENTRCRAPQSDAPLLDVSYEWEIAECKLQLPSCLSERTDMGSGYWPGGCCADGAMVSLVWSMAHDFGVVLTLELPEELRRIHTMTDLFFDSEGPTTRTRSPLTARHPPGARECTGRGCSCERSEMVARARSSRHAADSSWTPCAVPSYLVSGGPIIFARSNSVMPLWGFPATRSHLAAAPCWDRAGLPMASLA